MTKIPQLLRERNQWCLWKSVNKGGLTTKLPFQTNGENAKSNDPSTWTTFEAATASAAGYSGVGYVFSADDPFTGIDLDGCRNPETGEVSEWAREIIAQLESYAEVSPSGTGVKIFILGKLPFPNGKKVQVDAPMVCDKVPALEVYDHARYFAVTGWRVTGPHEPQERQEQLDALCAKFFPAAVPASRHEWSQPDAAMDRARKYLAKMPPAVSGQGGHHATFHVACVLVCGFSLTQDQAMQVFTEWNQTCQPPWNERELQHKIDDAATTWRTRVPTEWSSNYRARQAVASPQQWKRKARGNPRCSTMEAHLEPDV